MKKVEKKKRKVKDLKRKEKSEMMICYEMNYDVAGPEIMNGSSGLKFQQGDASEPTSKSNYWKMLHNNFIEVVIHSLSYH